MKELRSDEEIAHILPAAPLQLPFLPSDCTVVGVLGSDPDSLEALINTLSPPALPERFILCCAALLRASLSHKKIAALPTASSFKLLRLLQRVAPASHLPQHLQAPGGGLGDVEMQAVAVCGCVDVAMPYSACFPSVALRKWPRVQGPSTN